MPRTKERKRPINAFFRRVGLTLITLGILICATAVFYVLGAMMGYSCPIKNLIGFDCPGCGMTTAAVNLLTLNLPLALESNPAVFPFAFWVGLTSLRYLFKGNFKKIMSFWWVMLGVLPIVLIWAVRMFLI